MTKMPNNKQKINRNLRHLIIIFVMLISRFLCLHIYQNIIFEYLVLKIYEINIDENGLRPTQCRENKTRHQGIIYNNLNLHIQSIYGNIYDVVYKVEVFKQVQYIRQNIVPVCAYIYTYKYNIKSDCVQDLVSSFF